MKGRPSGIIMKMNSLTDRDILDKLSEASNAGVKIELIIRGICCLIPGIPGKTENITVTSIIGRFLEHSRVYCFGSGDDMKMYISSADLMTRNTERRNRDCLSSSRHDIKNRILGILKLQLSGNTKAWTLGPDGEYTQKVTTATRSAPRNTYEKAKIPVRSHAIIPHPRSGVPPA
jgi:polyphosphate kinase